jgi:hypothetical protein
MKKSNFTEEQIPCALHQADTGTSVQEVCRKIGISQATFYAWKKKLGGMGVSEIRRLRKLGAGIYEGIWASLRAFQRYGYQFEAMLKEHVVIEGKPSDVLLIRLLRREWEAFVLNHPSSDSGGSPS